MGAGYVVGQALLSGGVCCSPFKYTPVGLLASGVGLDPTSRAFGARGSAVELPADKNAHAMVAGRLPRGERAR